GIISAEPHNKLTNPRSGQPDEIERLRHQITNGATVTPIRPATAKALYSDQARGGVQNPAPRAQSSGQPGVADMKVFQFKRGAESWPAGENLVYPDDQLADPHGAVRDRTCPRARSNPQRHRRVTPHPGLRHGDADSDEIHRTLR